MEYSKKIIGAIFGIMVIACVVIAIMAMQGETKTTGQKPESVSGETLICSSDSISYPIFVYDGAIRRDLKITESFYDDVLKAISLEYALYYDDAGQIKASEAHNHGAMNKSFGKDGLGADALGAVYAKLSDAMKMNLYVTMNSLNSTTAKYFMINVQGEDRKMPVTPTEFRENYEEQGFICETGN